jgi:hypothetical protein
VAVVAVQCPACGSYEVVKYGQQPNSAQRYRCTNPHCQREAFPRRKTLWAPVGIMRFFPDGWGPLLALSLLKAIALPTAHATEGTEAAAMTHSH